MASIIDIANRGLTLLGADPITALADDTKEGRAVNRMYETTRNKLLRDHPWNFAMVRVALAANVTAPIWDYTNAFDLPSACLRIIEVDTTEEWQVEGRQIVSDAAAPLNILYVAEITDTEQYDAQFLNLFAIRLAADLAFDLTNSRPIAADMENKYFLALRDARLVDAQESLSADEDTWLEARA